LALNIATTDSFTGGGNQWKSVAQDFTEAVMAAELTDDRVNALLLLSGWDGHFVAGGQLEWASGTARSEAWILGDAWISEVLRLTFDDELGDMNALGLDGTLFNVLLHGLAGAESGIVNNYDWFTNLADPGAPQTAADIIVLALDNSLADLGPRPWTAERGEIVYSHAMLGEVWRMPFSNRSTYAHVVEFGPYGPVRIESMFPLGESGNILMNVGGEPVFDDHFFSLTPEFDAFAPRNFPLF
jgi:penicillin amidase